MKHIAEVVSGARLFPSQNTKGAPASNLPDHNETVLPLWRRCPHGRWVRDVHSAGC